MLHISKKGLLNKKLLNQGLLLIPFKKYKKHPSITFGTKEISPNTIRSILIKNKNIQVQMNIPNSKKTFEYEQTFETRFSAQREFHRFVAILATEPDNNLN